MIELVHKKKGEDAICGSESRQLVRARGVVTCLDCLEITKGRRKENHIIHNRTIALKPKHEIDAENKIEKSLFTAQEKMDIETGIFYKNLCLGFDVPSYGFNIMPTK